MSITFFDGFDFYTFNLSVGGLGAGGRKWDQVSNSAGAPDSPGRFGGQLWVPGTLANPSQIWDGDKKTIPNTSELIVGQAMIVQGGVVPSHPIIMFWDGNNPQCSVWIDPDTFTITLRTGRGKQITDTTLGDTGFVPPFTLWFYLEVKVQIGNPGNIEIRVNGQTKFSGSGQTQQTGFARCNKVSVMQPQAQSSFLKIDDFYILNTTDALRHVDFLGEVRVQTKYPDADGYRDDFLSSGGANYLNVNATLVNYNDTANFNYSGTVNAIDSYSIGNFTVSGTIFAVQENISFKKDDVGNRSVKPLMRTAGTNYLGSSFPCFSSYTYAGYLLEINPDTGLAWTLTELNAAEFGLTVDT